MDEFAQTRGADGLFDDDFTPIHEGSENHIPRQPRPHPPFPASQPDTPNIVSFSQNAIPSNNTDPTPLPQQTSKPPTAVRGDRTATGGVSKPKLTEDELSARLAAAKLNNAKRAEAHRLAEADEASFQQREARASQKRKEEGDAKRAMNMEREKNRLRKLGAQGGREWDEAKKDPAAGQRRGAEGSVVSRSGSPGNTYQKDDDHEEYSERRRGYGSRGGRGRGDRARGRGRGAFTPSKSKTTPQASLNSAADFPALPTAPSKEEKKTPEPSDKAMKPLQPAGRGESWADQVQDSKEPGGF